MSRLIIEDGRHGDGGPKTIYQVRRPGEDFENYPARESMSRHRKRDGNSLGDRLRPLRRYLRSQIGRPWSRVFSEICAVNDKRTTRGYHLLTHLFQYVLVDGVSYGFGHNFSDFKVDAYGVLREHDWRRTRWWYRKSSVPEPVEKIALSDGWQYRKVKGIWYRVHYKVTEIVVPGHFAVRVFGEGKTYERKYRHWVNTSVSREVAQDKKIQCGKKELKKIQDLLNAGRS